MTVAYLAGPEPLNDFRVLTALGVLPQNIYGFASDNSSFNNALAQVPVAVLVHNVEVKPLECLEAQGSLTSLEVLPVEGVVIYPPIAVDDGRWLAVAKLGLTVTWTLACTVRNRL